MDNRKKSYPQETLSILMAIHLRILKKYLRNIDNHLLYLKRNSLIDETGEIVTLRGLLHIERLKSELSLLGDCKDITYLPSLENRYVYPLVAIYLFNSNPPLIFYIHSGDIEYLVAQELITDDKSYRLTTKAIQTLQWIDKTMLIDNEHALVHKVASKLQAKETIFISVFMLIAFGNPVNNYYSSILEEMELVNGQTLSLFGKKVLLYLLTLKRNQLREEIEEVEI